MLVANSTTAGSVNARS